MSIKFKILGGYILIALLTSITMGLSQNQISKIQHMFIEVEAFSKEIRVIDQIEEKVWETRYLVDRYLRLNDKADGDRAKKKMKEIKSFLKEEEALHAKDEVGTHYREIYNLLEPYEVKFSNLGLRVKYLSGESDRLTLYALSAQRQFDRMNFQTLSTKGRRDLFHYRSQLSEVSILSAQLFYKYDQRVVDKNIKVLNAILSGLESIQQNTSGATRNRIQVLMYEVEEYLDSFEGAMSVIRKIDQEIVTTLDPIAPRIVDKVKELDDANWDKTLTQNTALNNDIETQINRVIILSIAIILLGIGIGLVFSKRLTQPIISLQQNAIQLSRGDLKVDIEVASDDELGSLAHSFNVMRNSISTRLEDLKELNKLSEKVLVAKTADEILDAVIEILSEKTGVQSGFIHLLDPKVAGLRESLKNKYQHNLIGSIDYYLKHTILNDAIKDEVVHELPKDELYSKVDSQAYLLVPLRVGHHLVGLLVFSGNEGQVSYKKGDEEFIRGAARTIMTALRRVQMMEIIKEKNESLQKANKAKDGLLVQLKEVNQSLEGIVEKRTADLSKALLEVKVASNRVTSSIKYASRIQASILPSLSEIQKVTQDSFFLWKPRDIVGGDFYYTNILENGYIIAMIDCTGHGVPGAFMTMLTVSGLKKIISGEQITDPSEICYRLNTFIQEALHQDSDHATSNDGLDAAICYVDQKNKKIQYVGARSPLLLIKNDKLQLYKPDRESIGYKSMDREPIFTTQEIEVEDGMMLYMYTDGMTDQLGGGKRIGFGKRRMHDIIFKNRHKSMVEQKKALLYAFEKFQGDNERQDDVTVVGIKL